MTLPPKRPRRDDYTFQNGYAHQPPPHYQENNRETKRSLDIDKK